jgi:MFS family permease
VSPVRLTSSAGRSWVRNLASLAAAVPFLRPGTTTPGATAPFVGAPSDAELAEVPQHHGPSKPLRSALRLSTAEGMFAEVVTSFSGGAVLTAWALHLGCGPLMVGILGALPFLSQVVQLPSAWASSIFGARPTCITAVGLSRQVLLPLTLLPLLDLTQDTQRTVLVAVALASAVLGVVGNNAWVTWMGDLVPRRIRGRYFGRRTALSTLGGTLASLAAGLLLDVARSSGHALALLALGACASGAITSWLMIRQARAVAAPETAPPARITWAALVEPLSCPTARRYLAYQAVWNSAIGISSAYYALHMLENLNMGYALIALHGAATATVRILIGPLWGRAMDRVGARPVLLFCSFGISLIPLYWLFPTADFLWPLVLEVVTSATLWSGHALAVFNLPLQVTPKKGRSFYLATFSMVGGLAFTAAAFTGGAMLEWLPRSFTVAGHSMFGVQVLFVISSVARLAGAVMGLRIVEPGSRPMGALTRLLTQGAALRAARLTAPVLRR